MKSVIYLDNSGTTRACELCKTEVTKWVCCCGNPSGDNKMSKKARAMIDDAKSMILKVLQASPDEFLVLFTSGGSESNSFIIRSSVEAHIRDKYGGVRQMILQNSKPHIVTSSIEHPCVLETCANLVSLGLCEVTYVDPDRYGQVHPTEVERSIKPNTCLVSVMMVNNEVGTLNDIQSIADITAKHRVAFHTDAVQGFGKYGTPIRNVDAISMSMHKLCGPMGVGVLVLRKSFVGTHALSSLIGGHQQYGLRGGTENVPAIAGVRGALLYTFDNRVKKNERLLKLKHRFVDRLTEYFPYVPYSMANSVDVANMRQVFFTVLGHFRSEHESVHILSVSFVHPNLCNLKIKRELADRGVVVATGSACSTNQPGSHVVDTLGCSPAVKKGVLRISLADSTAVTDVDRAVYHLVQVIYKMISD